MSTIRPDNPRCTPKIKLKMPHSFQTNCQLLLYAQLRDQTQLYLVFMNWIGKLKWVALPQCLAYASPVKRKLWCCAVNYLVLIWSTDLDAKSNGGMKFGQVISILFSVDESWLNGQLCYERWLDSIHLFWIRFIVDSTHADSSVGLPDSGLTQIESSWHWLDSNLTHLNRVESNLTHRLMSQAQPWLP